MWAIPGLDYVPAYFSPTEQKRLLTIIDGLEWVALEAGRVQHYGYRYDAELDRALPVGVLPDWLQSMAKRVCDDGYALTAPDQVTVDECLPGQGIAAHMDSEPAFSETVLAVSLGSSCVMRFGSVDGVRRASLLLQPGSLLVMRGEVRYRWTHEIEARLQDEIENLVITRRRWVCLTLRTAVLTPQ